MVFIFSVLFNLSDEMSSIEKYRKRHEKNFAEQMSKRTHFNEAEIERLVEMHKNALVGKYKKKGIITAAKSKKEAGPTPFSFFV